MAASSSSPSSSSGLSVTDSVDESLSGSFLDSKVKVGLAVAGAAAAGYILYRLLSSSTQSAQRNKLGRTEVHLKFSVQRVIVDAQKADSKFEQSFEWEIVLGHDYFYHVRPLRDGSQSTKVYFFEGPHRHQIATYYENTQKFAYISMLCELHIKLEDALRAAEILKRIDADPDLFLNNVPNLHIMRNSWSPLEKQSYTGYIDKANPELEQLPGNLFGGQIESSHYDPSSHRSTADNDTPIPRPDHGVSYRWSHTQEEVVDCTPLTPDEIQAFHQSGCFSSDHLHMFQKAMIWLVKIHPEILKDILARNGGFPPNVLWYRHLHDTETVFECIQLISCETKDAAPHFVPPPSISGFHEVMGSSNDTAWNAWIDEKFTHWDPPPQTVGDEIFGQVLAKALAERSDAACFDALLAIQEYSLQYNVDLRQIHQHLNTIGEIAEASQLLLSRQYLAVISQLLTQETTSQEIIYQILILLESLSHSSSSPRTPILLYWKAACLGVHVEALKLCERLIDYNPYLIGVWIELAAKYGDVQEIEKSWTCRAIAQKLDPTESHTYFESSFHKSLQNVIRTELGQFL